MLFGDLRRIEYSKIPIAKNENRVHFNRALGERNRTSRLFSDEASSSWWSGLAVALAEFAAAVGGGEGGNCTMGSDVAAEVDSALLLTSVTVGVGWSSVSLGVPASSVCSLSVAGRVTNWVRISLIRCMKKFCRLRLGAVGGGSLVVRFSCCVVTGSLPSSAVGRDSGPEIEEMCLTKGIDGQRSVPVSLQSPRRRSRLNCDAFLSCSFDEALSGVLLAVDLASYRFARVRFSWRCSLRRAWLCSCDRFCFGLSK